nr:maltase 2-like [Maniola hyperantus]
MRLNPILLLPAAMLLVYANELGWWKSSIFYQIYPRSFKDSDGDGIGDLKGITSKLEHLKEIGVGAAWLSPIFKSPMYDFGYDISDFYSIQEEYGTMQDFEDLLAKAKELDIKIILDLVPNHTSNESVWFQEALKGHEKYYDYFIWEDGKVDENGVMHPPNNWRSVFYYDAWTYREEVGKYYFHQFGPYQPDLNFRNPAVVDEMNNIIRYWLDKGCAGFRVDAVMYLMEVDKNLFGGKYPDEPLTGLHLDMPEHYDYVEHIYTREQPELYDLIYSWREILDEYTEKDGLERVMLTEAYTTSMKRLMRYFGDGDRKGAQIPFNFILVTDVNGDSTAADFKYALDKFITYKPIDKLPNWVASNHDNHRIASKFSPKMVDGINMMLLLLPGTAVTYQGDEIGMENGHVSYQETQDPIAFKWVNYQAGVSRDPQRTPFQWNSEKNAGFSAGNETWLPITASYKSLNVEVEKQAERSHLKVYKKLAKLRREPVFRLGRYESVAFNDDVFAFRRWHEGEIYVIVINIREQRYTLDLTYFENVSGHLEIIVNNVESPKKIGDLVEASSLKIAPGESLVLRVVQ